eukprot:TRINITY_DN32448_c0_g1_i1.p1 TRINITY_DN32448_c0_g1~~TRINITY_DN32448_c0_g1_i1.p1  ORF type:complete len:1625 (+),score=748.09 TRINITY_DN32448_c0_g1_i1:57-4877(+)
MAHALHFATFWGYGGSRIAALRDGDICFPVGTALVFGNVHSARQQFIWNEKTLRPVGPVAFNGRQTMFAFGEMGDNPNLYVYSYPDMRETQCISGGTRLEYADLSFSRSGLFFAALGALPDFNLSVYSVDATAKSLRLIVRSGGAQHQPKTVSFNPAVKDDLVTTGNGHITFWKMEKAQGVHGLAAVEGKLVNHHVRVASHCHAPNGETLGGTSHGDIYRFDSVTGYGEPWWENPSGQPGGRDALVSLNVTRHHIVAAAADGIIRFFRHDSRAIERSIALASSAVRHVCITPEWNSLVVGCGDGLIFSVHLPGYDSAQLPAEEFRATKERVWPVSDFCGGPVSGLCHLQKGSVVVSVSDDCTMRVWDYRRNALLSKSEIGQQPSSCASGVAVSANLVAVGSETSHLRLVNVQDPQNPRIVLQERLCDKGEVTRCVFSDDGSMLAAVVQGVGVFFVRTSDSHSDILGHVPTPDSPCKDLLWVEGERDQLLTAHANGDVRHLYAPTEGSRNDSGELSQDLIQTLWKLDFPVERMALGKYMEEMYMLVVLSRDKETKVYTLDKQQKAGDVGKVSAKKPQSNWKDHDKLGTAAIVTADKQHLFSAGADGKIVLRDLSNRTGDKAKWQIRKHAMFSTQSSRGGITAMVASPDQKWLITAGGDGNIGVWTWGHSRDPVPLSIVDQPELAEVADEENNYLVKRQLEHDRMLEIKHQAYRDSVIEKIGELRQQLQAYKSENRDAAPEEKLDIGEFMIRSQREELHALGDEMCEKKADDIKWQNLTHHYLRDRIEQECYSCMRDHLIVVKPIRPEREHEIQVPNYNTLKPNQQDFALLRKIKFLRQVEQLEWQRRPKFHMLDDLTEEEMVEVDGEMVPASQVKSKTEEPQSPDGKGKTPAQEEEKKPATPEEEARDDVSPYLYNKFIVFTRARTLTQIQLLQRQILNGQLELNAEVTEVLQAKKQSIQAINDTINKKVRQIQKELQVDDAVPDAQAAGSEKPDRILSVADSEIKAKRHLSPEEQKKHEEEMRKEARRKAESEDGSVTRALAEMMDGKLERDERQVKEIKMPVFGQEGHKDYKPVEEWTDEEQRAWNDYRKRVQKQQEEEQKHRSELQQELRDLRKELSRIEGDFEKRLQALFDKKLNTDTQVYQHELQIIKLVQSVVQQEEMESHAIKLAKMVDDVKQEAQKSSGIVAESARELQDMQLRYEELANSEKRKTGDRDIKSQSPFNEAEEFCDMLIKLLRRTTRPKRERTKRDKRDGKREEPTNPDPFTWVDEEEEEKRKKAVIDPHDAPKLEKPEALREDLWTEFLDFRRERMQAEKDLKVMQDELVERRRAHDRVQRENRQHQQRLEQQLRLLGSFNTQMLHEGYNLDILHTFKQGQIEVEQEAVVTDYADAILIHKDDIERLNEQIRDHGKQKVHIMRDMTDFRKEIRLIEWDNEMLAHQREHHEMDLRHLHTLRVTKAMQEFIKGGQENHHEIERAKLVKKIEHVQKTMQGKIDEKKLAMLKVKRVIREKEQENGVLGEQVKEAQQLVSEREEIQHLQSTGLDHQRNLKLMKDMRVTRKLEDVAKAQQEEMQMLKKEIDKLRERTFPSFAVVSKRVVGNPDQA